VASSAERNCLGNLHIARSRLFESRCVSGYENDKPSTRFFPPFCYVVGGGLSKMQTKADKDEVSKSRSFYADVLCVRPHMGVPSAAASVTAQSSTIAELSLQITRSSGTTANATEIFK